MKKLFALLAVLASCPAVAGTAPIVQMHDDHMDTIAWLNYETGEDYAILFCTPKTKSTVSCLVFVGKTDHGPAIISADVTLEQKEASL